MLIRHWMHTNVISVSPQTSLLKCKSLLNEHGLVRLPVTDADNNVVGLVSNSDIKAFSPRDTTGLEILELLDILGETPVKQVMTINPHTIGIDNTVDNAALLMAEKSISCLPVVDDNGKLAGMITDKDLFRTFVKLTGAHEDSVQMSFQLENKPGTLRAKLDGIRKHGGRILTVLTTASDESSRIVAVRFRRMDKTAEDALIADLASDDSMLYWGRDGEIHIVN